MLSKPTNGRDLATLQAELEDKIEEERLGEELANEEGEVDNLPGDPSRYIEENHKYIKDRPPEQKSYYFTEGKQARRDPLERLAVSFGNALSFRDFDDFERAVEVLLVVAGRLHNEFGDIEKQVRKVAQVILKIIEEIDEDDLLLATSISKKEPGEETPLLVEDEHGEKRLALQGTEDVNKYIERRMEEVEIGLDGNDHGFLKNASLGVVYQWLRDMLVELDPDRFEKIYQMTRQKFKGDVNRYPVLDIRTGEVPLSALRATYYDPQNDFVGVRGFRIPELNERAIYTYIPAEFYFRLKEINKTILEPFVYALEREISIRLEVNMNIRLILLQILLVAVQAKRVWNKLDPMEMIEIETMSLQDLGLDQNPNFKLDEIADYMTLKYSSALAKQYLITTTDELTRDEQVQAMLKDYKLFSTDFFFNTQAFISQAFNAVTLQDEMHGLQRFLSYVINGAVAYDRKNKMFIRVNVKHKSALNFFFRLYQAKRALLDVERKVGVRATFREKILLGLVSSEVDGMIQVIIGKLYVLANLIIAHNPNKHNKYADMEEIPEMEF